VFHATSRYSKVPQTVVTTGAGREVQVVTLRRLPHSSGEAVVVQGNDRLDVMACQRLDDATRFWRIADANSELEANTLLREAGRVIEVPKQ